MIYKIYISREHGYEKPIVLRKEKKVIDCLNGFVKEGSKTNKLMVIEHDTSINAEYPSCLITSYNLDDYKNYVKILKKRK